MIPFGNLNGGEIFVTRNKDILNDTSWNTKLDPNHEFWSSPLISGEENYRINAISNTGYGFWVDGTELVHIPEDPLNFGELFEGERFTWYGRDMGGDGMMKIPNVLHDGKKFNAVSLRREHNKRLFWINDDVRVTLL